VKKEGGVRRLGVIGVGVDYGVVNMVEIGATGTTYSHIGGVFCKKERGEEEENEAEREKNLVRVCLL
jgi:hypothetical protein